MSLHDPHRNTKRVETDDAFDWEAFRASVKRVRAIPYREESLGPFAERDAWLDLPEPMRRDPARYGL